jgi:hypothetical protein
MIPSGALRRPDFRLGRSQAISVLHRLQRSCIGRPATYAPANGLRATTCDSRAEVAEVFHSFTRARGRAREVGLADRPMQPTRPMRLGGGGACVGHPGRVPFANVRTPLTVAQLANPEMKKAGCALGGTRGGRPDAKRDIRPHALYRCRPTRQCSDRLPRERPVGPRRGVESVANPPARTRHGPTGGGVGPTWWQVQITPRSCGSCPGIRGERRPGDWSRYVFYFRY